MADMSKSVRLYDANAYDNPSTKTFVIQLFALDEAGASHSLWLTDYTPFFYVKVPEGWDTNDVACLVKFVREDKGIGEGVLSGTLEEHQKLYGFDNNTRHQFARLIFRNIGAFHRAKRLWYEASSASGEGGLRPKGLWIPKSKCHVQLYEAHIPPLLRMYHILSLSPSGWVRIPKDRIVDGGAHAYCDYEATLTCDCLVPEDDKEASVPYKILSFDIEASSSHGDFPLPIKTFRKFASEVVAHAIETGIAITTKLISRSMECALGLETEADTACGRLERHISPVYLKRGNTGNLVNSPESIRRCLAVAMNEDVSEHIARAELAKTDAVNASKVRGIQTYFGETNKNNDESGCGGGACESSDDEAHEDAPICEEASENAEDQAEDGPRGWVSNENMVALEEKRCALRYKRSRGSLLEVLNAVATSKEDRVTLLDKALSNAFKCGVEGDKVTFIGSVFYRYGEPDSYLNHCIALDTCDAVDGATIETYSDESDVLLAWKALILREQPDIVIGYNIFGFDYDFMFKRSKELSIVREFLTTLSRNKDDRCFTSDRDGEVRIASSKVRLASGEHELCYINMPGRVQVDLFNVFRRDYNLPSYKLDYVAGHFIGDRVRAFTRAVGSNRTLVASKNLVGLYDEAYVTFEVTEHSSEMYRNGEKFRVCDVNGGDGTFCILHPTEGAEGAEGAEGLLGLNGKVVKWGLAKDDVTPQDIFRLTGKGPAERAVVAKYCIQDCRLPMHLFNKVDLMTGFVEMAKLCSVPINFIVMRGQGIKLTSYMAKKCREMGTLIPTIAKSTGHEAYEGAIVLEPKTDMYLDEPIACVDYGSLYPSSMISDNISHDTKVSVRQYDLDGNLLCVSDKVSGRTVDYTMGGSKTKRFADGYDNESDGGSALVVRGAGVKPPESDALVVGPDGRHYVDIEYDSYKWIPNVRGKAEKKCVGKNVCRYVQPDPVTGKGVGIIPAILKELLAARKATRRLIPMQNDEFMKNVLDKRQLSIKVTANSIYGQCGAKTSTFYDMDVAASTTAVGRKLLMFARDTIETEYGGGATFESESHGVVKTNAHCVYGDSVVGETPIYVRNRTSALDVNILTIDSIAETYGESRWKVMADSDKEFCELRDVETWSDSGWTPCYRVIRHALPSHKRIVRVVTHTGMVDVTDDHSLLRADGMEVSPKDVRIGDRLLCRGLPEDVRAAGFVTGDGLNRAYSTQLDAARCMSKLRVGTAGVRAVKIDGEAYEYEICDRVTEEDDHGRVLTLYAVPLCGKYVYDLTTENHHFAAGIGSLVVHNTDSAFVSFGLTEVDGKTPITGRRALEISIEAGQRAGALVTRHLKPPHDLEYEKTFMPFCLLSKKRYVGMLYETDPTKCSRKSMGIVLKRRDNAPIVKDVYGGIIDILMKTCDIDAATRFLNDNVGAIVRGDCPISKFVITKSLRGSYAKPKQVAHKVLADRIAERDPGNAPRSGDRIAYVHVHVPNGANLLTGEKIELPGVVLEKHLRIDYTYYITNQVMKPIQQLFALVLEKLPRFRNVSREYERTVDEIWVDGFDTKSIHDKVAKLRMKMVKRIMFDDHLVRIKNAHSGMSEITQFFGPSKK